jgi:hypothetical protein
MKDVDLVRLFGDLNDETLWAQLHSGKLTESAQSLALAEARRRGLDVSADTAGLPAPNDTDSNQPPAEFVQIARYLQPMEAYVLLGGLEAEGIQAHLAGAGTVETNPLWFNAMGGVRLFVLRSQYQQALAVMAARDKGDYVLEDDAPSQEPEPPVDPDAGKRRFGWIVLVLPALVFAVLFAILVWMPRCPAYTYCTGHEQQTAGGYLFKLLLSLGGLGPAIFVMLYLGNRFKRTR